MSHIVQLAIAFSAGQIVGGVIASAVWIRNVSRVRERAIIETIENDEASANFGRQLNDYYRRQATRISANDPHSNNL